MDEQYPRLLACFGNEHALASWLLHRSPRWRQALQRALEPHGLRENELRLLCQLAAQKTPFSQQALGLSLARDASILARSLRRLEAEGLVTREADQQDRRALWVTLTTPGRTLADQLVATLPSVLRSALNEEAEGIS
jgi:DNA-binding MarR family transcriptional regulator